MCSLIPCPQTHPNTQLVVSSYGQKKKKGRSRHATHFTGNGLNGQIRGLENVACVCGPSELKKVFHRTESLDYIFFKSLPTQDMNDTNAAPATESVSGVTSS